MNNTQKILIAVGVGVSVAYLYNKYKKGAKTTALTPTKGTGSSVETANNTASAEMSREEKEEYILDNASASADDIASGFEGTQFVWNPTIEKMYPVGTIEVGKTPAYMDAVFLSAEGDLIANIPNSVLMAEKSLKDLNDSELDLLFQVVKTMNENSSVKNEEDAIKQLKITNPNIIGIIRGKLKMRLNDIKMAKKDANWKDSWKIRKEQRSQKRKEFLEKVGFSKDKFNKLVRQKCGRKPMRDSEFAKYKMCVEAVADKVRSKMKAETRSELSSAPVSVKAEITDNRQQGFANQVINRNDGAMFGGHRWDGKSNDYVEKMVDAGLV